jgi:hypothetical protein
MCSLARTEIAVSRLFFSCLESANSPRRRFIHVPCTGFRDVVPYRSPMTKRDTECAYKVDDQNDTSVPRASRKQSLEAFKHHFKLFLRGCSVAPDEAYTAIAAPRAEIGVYQVSDGSQRPHRCKIRAPGFAHLAGSDFIGKFCGILELRTMLISSSSATPVLAGRRRHQ